MMWRKMAPLGHFAPEKWPFCPTYDFDINIAT